MRAANPAQKPSRPARLPLTNWAVIFLVLVLGGCSTASHAQIARSGAPAVGSQTPLVTPAPPAMPAVTFSTASGDTQTMYVEIADTEQLRELGLMNRPALTDDQGMIFMWGGPSPDSFWMKDTEIDLSIAFIDQDGLIVDIQEMQAETLDTHSSAAPYWYAIEADAGWYDRHGVQVGDTADVSQALAASTVFGAAVATPTAP